MPLNLTRLGTLVGCLRTGLPRALLAAGTHCVLLALGCAPTYSTPSYAQLDRVIETPVVVGKDWPLHGILTCPSEPGVYPGLVLVGGSGPVDRDASIGPNKPFRDIALGLASHGTCVLRYDKPEDYGFMFTRSFVDPDGHGWGLVHMSTMPAQK